MDRLAPYRGKLNKLIEDGHGSAAKAIIYLINANLMLSDDNAKLLLGVNPYVEDLSRAHKAECGNGALAKHLRKMAGIIQEFMPEESAEGDEKSIRVECLQAIRTANKTLEKLELPLIEEL